MAKKPEPALPGEAPLDYVERVSTKFDAVDLKYVREHFELSDLAAKSMAVASEEFNVRFSYDGWSGRHERGIDGYGAKMWLKNKYNLDDAAADQVIAGFRSGNKRALVDHLGFEGLARNRLTKAAQASLEDLGLIPERDA